MPRVVVRLRFGDMQWSMYGSGAPEARKLWYFGELLSEASALRELKVFRTAPSLLARYREIQARIFALGKRPLDRYRRVSVLMPLVDGAVAHAFAAEKWLRVGTARKRAPSPTLRSSHQDAGDHAGDRARDDDGDHHAAGRRSPG